MAELDLGIGAARDDDEVVRDGLEDRRVHRPALVEERGAQLGLEPVQRKRMDVDVRLVDVVVALDLPLDQDAI